MGAPFLSGLAALLVLLSLASAPRAQAAPPAPLEDPVASARARGWNQLTAAVIQQHFIRHPDRALERARPEAGALGLGTFGTGATLSWRETLEDALARVARIDAEDGTPLERARLAAFHDWLQVELLLLDELTSSNSDPSGYVRRAYRILRAADEALWIPPEERRDKVTALMGQLPEYLRDARIALNGPSPAAIDRALEDLIDLGELVSELEASAPPRPAQPAPPPSPKAKAARARTPEVTPRAALDAFRNWLLEQHRRAGGLPPRLENGEWMRLANLVSGTDWRPGEIKVRCLRELARLDLAAREEPSRRRKRPALDGLAARTRHGAAVALGLGQEANVLPLSLDARRLEFLTEESLRTGTAFTSLRPGTAITLRGYIELPDTSWPPERTLTRYRSLMGAGQTALGIRLGFAGEALVQDARRRPDGAPPVLLDSRLVREGFGLFAQDWILRVDWVENPLRADEDLVREIEFQRGFEAARLVAALELHAEGIALDEAALGFRRRTGVDRDTAQAEASAAQHDPLHGIGYLGLLEFRALEERLAAATTPRKGLRLSVLLAQRFPELRPSDLSLRGLAVR